MYRHCSPLSRLHLVAQLSVVTKSVPPAARTEHVLTQLKVVEDSLAPGSLGAHGRAPQGVAHDAGAN